MEGEMVACNWMYPMFSSSQETSDTTKHTLWVQLCVGRYEIKKEEDLAKGFKWAGKAQTKCVGFCWMFARRSQVT